VGRDLLVIFAGTTGKGAVGNNTSAQGRFKGRVLKREKIIGQRKETVQRKRSRKKKSTERIRGKKKVKRLQG